MNKNFSKSDRKLKQEKSINYSMNIWSKKLIKTLVNIKSK